MSPWVRVDFDDRFLGAPQNRQSVAVRRVNPLNRIRGIERGAADAGFSTLHFHTIAAENDNSLVYLSTRIQEEKRKGRRYFAAIRKSKHGRPICLPEDVG